MDSRFRGNDGWVGSRDPRVKQPAVYLMALQRNGTLYLGVTSNLPQRVHQHRVGTTGGFTSRYDVHLLVWFEMHETMESAIHREKRLKKWERRWKLDLIEGGNPDWNDLAESLGFTPLDSRVRGNDG